MSSISSGTTLTTALVQTADTSGVLQLQTNGTTTAVTIDTNQNFGLGVTPSANWSGVSALQLNSAGSLSSNNLYTAMQNGLVATSGGYAWKYLTSTYGLAYLQSNTNGQHQWYIASSGTAGNVATPTQAMTLDASGNLLVGTTSATYSSSGRGVIEVNGSSDNVFAMKVAGSGNFYIQSSASATNIWNVANAPLAFATNNTERARIDTSGNLGVGTASAYSAVNVYVGTATNGATAQGGVSIQGGSSASTDSGHASGTSSGTSYQRFIYNASVIGSITQNGTTGVLYNLTSDYRLKNNPVALTGAKDFVMALQPKTWDWWDNSGKGVGFIAHEFMEVAKYSGHGEKDAVDADGKPVYQSIQPSSSEVMANLVSFIQELSAQVTTLQSQVTALKG